MTNAPPPIRVLDPLVANQIAAGEVVTRPASVVKELVENALDAGARRIDVRIESGGTRRIVVADDGHGMAPGEAELALERHATSKIRSAHDLATIRTLGFRGEALPSIASVSRLFIRTRAAREEAGTELRIEGGRVVGTAPIGCGLGTTIEVADLFFNVPARRKFLRAMSTESAHVTAAVRGAALAYPDVHVTLTRDGRKAKEWLRAAAWVERAADVLGFTGGAHCTGERGPVRIEALLAPPDKARAGAAALQLFVNGRAVQDRSLARAVLVAYGPALDRGRYPLGAVMLFVAPEFVDVNVHPQKAEVRFAHARAVTEAVLSVTRAGLEQAFGLTGGGPPSAAAPTESARPSGSAADRAAAQTPPDRWAFVDSGQRSPPPAPHRPLYPDHPASDAESAQRRDAPDAEVGSTLPTGQERFVAELRDGLLLFEAGDGLLAVERRTAERHLARARLLRDYHRGGARTQRLLFPVVGQVDAAARGAVQRTGPSLERLGIDLRVTGPSSVTMYGISATLAGASADAVLRTTVDRLGLLGREPGEAQIAVLATVLADLLEPSTEPLTATAALELWTELARSGGAEPGAGAVRRIPWRELRPPRGVR